MTLPKILIVCTLMVVALGCGDLTQNPRSQPNKTDSEQPQAPAQAEGTGQQTQDESQNSGEEVKSPRPRSAKKQSKKNQSDTNGPGTQPSKDKGDVGQADGQKKDQGVGVPPNTQPSVPAPTNPSSPKSPSVENAKRVVGLGSTSQKPEDLLSRGYSSAIFEAKICRITGMFSNSSKCFVVLGDGAVEWVKKQHRDAILDFIVQLESEKEQAKDKDDN